MYLETTHSIFLCPDYLILTTERSSPSSFLHGQVSRPYPGPTPCIPLELQVHTCPSSHKDLATVFFLSLWTVTGNRREASLPISSSPPSMGHQYTSGVRSHPGHSLSVAPSSSVTRVSELGFPTTGYLEQQQIFIYIYNTYIIYVSVIYIFVFYIYTHMYICIHTIVSIYVSVYTHTHIYSWAPPVC